MKHSQQLIFYLTMLLISGSGAIAQTSLNTGAIQASDGSGINQTLSIGQVFYQQQSNGTLTQTQGIQQPLEFDVLAVDETNEIAVQSTVFPNPTTGLVQLQLSQIENGLSYSLYNSLGQQIATSKIREKNTSITLDTLASGIYILNLLQDNAPIKTIRIIKQ